MKLIKLITFFLFIYASEVLANSKDSLNKPTKLIIGFGLNTTITRSLMGPSWSLNYTNHSVEPILTFNPSIQATLKLKKTFYLNTALTYCTIGYKERISESLINVNDRVIFHRDKFLGLNFNIQYHFNSFFVGLGTSFLALTQYKKIEDGKINSYGPNGYNGISAYFGDYNFLGYGSSPLQRLLYTKDFKCGFFFSTKKHFVIVPEITGSLYSPLNKKFGLFPGVGYFSTGINLSILYKLK